MSNNVISKIQLPNNSIYDLKDSNAKRLQDQVLDPIANGNAISFIDTISQNEEGIITPTKKNVPNASQSIAGLMSANDKKKLDGIAAGAQVTSVNNQTGAVSITPANIGAVAKTDIVDISHGGTNSSTSDGARENIGIYTSYIDDVDKIVNANPTITTMDALVQYVFDTYLLPKNKSIECCTTWAVTNTTDSRCVGANADFSTIYTNLTGVMPRYGPLTFERIPHANKIVVTYTPLKSGSASTSKCPQIYATYGSDGNEWATGTKLNNASGWYIKGSTRVKGNAETSYRWGDVNLTPANIGAVVNDGPSDFRVRKLSVSQASDLYSLRGTVGNTTNTNYNAHDVSVNFQSVGITAYDHTNSTVIWSINPIHVKGNAESSYRTGEVNITPAHIGLGSATNNLTAHNTYDGTLQTFGFSYTVDNSLNTTKNGHNMSLIIDNDDLALYDHTDKRATWSIKPYNTRVKGNAEGAYRTGDVNLTPANIGALAKETDRTTFSNLNNTTLVGHEVLTNESGKTGYVTNLPPGMTSGNKWYNVYLFGQIQMAIGYSEPGAFWVRSYTNGEWTSWQLIGGPSITGSVTSGGAGAISSNNLTRSGNVCTMHVWMSMTNTLNGTNGLFGTVPDGFRPSQDRYLAGYVSSVGAMQTFRIKSDGQIVTATTSATYAASGFICLSGSYII